MSTTTAAKPRPQAKVASDPAMKLTIDRAEFARALAHATSVVERRNTIPVLSNVLLEATADGLRIVATDLNLQIGLVVPANVETEGSTTVSAQLLHSIVRELADGSQVELSVREGRLSVISGRSRYKLATLPADQFPAILTGETVAELSIAGPDLLKVFQRVSFAQSDEIQTRYYLCGINVDVQDGNLVFTATDGNCLASATVPGGEGATLTDTILPTKLVATLSKLIEDHEGEITLTFEQRKVTATIGSTVLTSKLVDGTYPDWRRVVPSGTDKRLLVDIRAFEAALRRAAVICNERTRVVKIEIGADKLTISATSPEFGTAVEELPCVWNAGEFTVGFNSRLLLEMLRAAGEGELQVDFIDPAAPPLFTNPADETAKWVVMPFRV